MNRNVKVKKVLDKTVLLYYCTIKIIQQYKKGGTKIGVEVQQ